MRSPFIRNVISAGMLCWALSAHSQICANYQAMNINCTGANNCVQSVSVLRPYYGSVGYCLSDLWVACCNTQIHDFEVGDYCGGVCGNDVKALLTDPSVMEFALTHTLWIKDCSGRYGPFARSWDGPAKSVDVRPKPLSGIGD